MANKQSARKVFLYGIFLEAHNEGRLQELGGKPLEMAALQDHSLRTCGIYTVVGDTGKQAFGVVWQTTRRMEQFLDAVEGVDRGFYFRKPLSSGFVYQMHNPPTTRAPHDNRHRALRSARRLGLGPCVGIYHHKERSQ